MTRVLPWLATGVTLGTMPYVVLKISWLAGGDIGLRDSALMQTTTYMVANSITLVLDLVVVALAWVLAVATRRRLLVGAQVVLAWPWLFALPSAGISPILVGGASAGALAGLGFLQLASGVGRVWLGPAVAEGAERGSLVVTGVLCVVGALGSVATVRRFGMFAIVCAWLGTGAMVCWSGYILLVAAVDAAVAEGTPLPLTVLAAVSGVVLVATLAMALQAMSQEHRLIRLEVETHPTMRLD